MSLFHALGHYFDNRTMHDLKQGTILWMETHCDEVQRVGEKVLQHLNMTAAEYTNSFKTDPAFKPDALIVYCAAKSLQSHIAVHLETNIWTTSKNAVNSDSPGIYHIIVLMIAPGCFCDLKCDLSHEADRNTDSFSSDVLTPTTQNFQKLTRMMLPSNLPNSDIIEPLTTESPLDLSVTGESLDAEMAQVNIATLQCTPQIDDASAMNPSRNKRRKGDIPKRRFITDEGVKEYRPVQNKHILAQSTIQKFPGEQTSHCNTTRFIDPPTSVTPRSTRLITKAHRKQPPAFVTGIEEESVSTPASETVTATPASSTCPICDNVVPEKDISNHVQQQHQKYYCNRCKTVHSTLKGFKDHCKKHKDNSFQCTVCSQTFSYNSDLKRHIRKHSQEKNFICEECGKGYKHKSDLIFHIESKHRVSEATFLCEICGKAFKSVRNVKQHKKTHDPPTHKCDICNESFKWPMQLWRHKDDCH